MNVQRRIIDQRDEHFTSAIEAAVDGWLQGRSFDNRDYFRSLVRVIRGVARRGGVIFLGRAANLILGAVSALNVRVTAPRDVRIIRLMRYLSIDEAEATKRLDRSDRERDEFIRHFFRAERANPAHFDLMISTGRVEPSACVPIVLAALRARGVEIGKAPRG
jgi:cytidylate kinase